MTSATEAPPAATLTIGSQDAPTLTGEMQAKIIKLNDECVRLLHEFTVKNDEARELHKEYKESCKKLHELISSTRVSLPLFDGAAAANGHANVGAGAAEEAP